MGTDQLPGHAPAFRRADMTAEYLCQGFHIATALGMYDLAVLIRLAVAAMSFHRRNIAAVFVNMNTRRNCIIAVVSVHMTAVVSFHRRGIPTLFCVLRVVFTQSVAFRSNGLHREIAQHQNQCQNATKCSLEPIRFHIQALHCEPFLSIITVYHFFRVCPEKTNEKG